MNNEFSVAIILWTMSDGEFQRPEISVVHLHILLSKSVDSFLFRQTAGSVLDRREYGGGNVCVVHKFFAIAVQSLSRTTTNLLATKSFKVPL